MAKYNYSFNAQENMAKAVGRNLSISPKYAIEICSYLRGKNLEKSKQFLQNVIQMKAAVPLRKYNHGAGHRHKLGPGKYPINASSEILKLLDSVTSNAQSKGLATGKLEIVHMNAHRGTRVYHRGRQIRRTMKQANVEVVVAEVKELKK